MNQLQKINPTPVTLLEKAIEKGADISQLKELMDLQERWEKKEAKKAFFDALSRFQTIVPVLNKKKTAKINSQKGNYSYKYADLGSITAEIKSALNECGLSYRWEFEEKNQLMKVTCLISHRDGHTETTSMEAGKDASGAKNEIQQRGSTQTYLQRYTLIGALGLSTADDDNDGKSHSPVKEESEEDFLQQWQAEVNKVRNKVELTSLYLKNKKVVDSDKRIQEILKNKEVEFKNSAPKKQVELP